MSNLKKATASQPMVAGFAPKAKQRIKKLMIYLLFFLIVIGVVISLFINFHPGFVGNPSNEQKKVYSTFDNYVKGKFVYQAPTNINGSASNSSSAFKIT